MYNIYKSDGTPVDIQTSKQVTKMKNNACNSLIQKKHFVYRWDNIETKEYYIGKHSGLEDDGYVASGKLFMYKYNKNKDNWKRTILGFYDSSETALKMEIDFIQDKYKTDDLCLNLAPGGNYHVKLDQHEYEHLVRRKYYKDEYITIYEWIYKHLFFKYACFGNNILGENIFIDTTPINWKKFLNHAKQTDELVIYELLEDCFNFDYNTLTLIMNDNYKKYNDSDQKQEILKIKDLLQRIVNSYDRT